MPSPIELVPRSYRRRLAPLTLIAAASRHSSVVRGLGQPPVGRSASLTRIVSAPPAVKPAPCTELVVPSVLCTVQVLTSIGTSSTPDSVVTLIIGVGFADAAAPVHAQAVPSLVAVPPVFNLKGCASV